LFAAITAIVTSFVLGSGDEPRSVERGLAELEQIRERGLVSDVEYEASRSRKERDRP